MTIKELYDSFGGNYDDIIERLGTDGIVERILLKYPNDGSMERLKNAVAANDIEEAFQAAHAMKGVTDNLALTGLADASKALTEQLRSRQEPIDMGLYEKVCEEYDVVIAALESYN